MANSWRLNVWRTGWSYDRFLLCARITDGPFIGHYLGVRKAGAIREVVEGAPSLEGYVNFWAHLFFTNETGFPYGIAVEPDTPQ